MSCNCNNTSSGCGCESETPCSTCTSGCESTMCPEDHTQEVINKQILGAVKIETAWNIPDCGETAVVTICGLEEVAIGSYLWAANYGYFEITGVNANDVTLRNNCNTGNASVGAEVPACTNFIFAPPPSTTSGGGTDVYPYLAADFTAPANGDCLAITLTNVNGLAVGKNVSIAGGTYEIDEIIDSTTIKICNNGAGVTPGTVVYARNAADELQYPVIMIDANQCTNTEVTRGALIVCKNNLAQPLAGTVLNSVPVLKDVDTNEVEFTPVAFPVTNCTALIAPMTLVPGDAIQDMLVASTAGFSGGDIIQIGDRTDRFEISTIYNGNLMDGYLVPIPSAVETIPTGTSVCEIGCCEQLERDLCEMIEEKECPQIDSYNTGLIVKCHQHAGDPNQPPIDIVWGAAPDYFYHTAKVSVQGDGSSALISVTNNLSNHNMLVELDLNLFGFHSNIGNFSGTITDVFPRYGFGLASNIDGAGDQLEVGQYFSIDNYINPLHNGGDAFPEADNWGQAGANFWVVKPLSLHCQKEIAPGETVVFSIYEYFGYYKAAGADTSATDDMCYRFRWDLKTFRGTAV